VLHVKTRNGKPAQPAPPAAVKRDELEELRARATEFTVNMDEPPHEWIRVALTCRAGEGPHRPPHDTWAVRKGALCLNENGSWEIERQPSNRDAAYLAQRRWPLEEALTRAEDIAFDEERLRADAP
jgi:hypothetical protein